jgi:hypothetical protein
VERNKRSGVVEQEEQNNTQKRNIKEEWSKRLSKKGTKQH